jgi:hypothetical protein
MPKEQKKPKTATCNVSKKCKRTGWSHCGGKCGYCHVKDCTGVATAVADAQGTPLNTCEEHIGAEIEK